MTPAPAPNSPNFVNLAKDSVNPVKLPAPAAAPASGWTFAQCFDWHCRLGIGWLFMYTGFLKIADPAIFAEAVRNYQMLPPELVGVFALTLPMVEIVAGAALAFTKWRREAALVVLAMLGAFLVALVSAAVRGLDISCGCFGDEPATGTLGLVKDIIRDLLLCLPTLWLLRRG